MITARGSGSKVGRFSGRLNVLREEFNVKVQEIDLLRRERDDLRLKVDLQAKELETFRRNISVCPVCKPGARRESRAVHATSIKPIPSKATSRRGTSLAISVAPQLPSGSPRAHRRTEESPRIGKLQHQTSRLTGSPPSAPFTSSTVFSHLAITEEPVFSGESGVAVKSNVRPPRYAPLLPAFPSDSREKTPTSHPAGVSSPPFVPTASLKREQDWSVKFHNEGRKNLKVHMMFELVHKDSVRSVKFSDDGKYLATGSGDNAYIYDVKSGLRICVLVDPTSTSGVITGVYFSPCGKYLATASNDSNIRIWEIDEKRVRNVFKGHTSSIFSIAFSPDGRSIASASRDNTVRVWNMHSGGMTIFSHDDPDSLHLTHDFNAVVWSPDGRYIVGGHDDGFMRIWDVRRPDGAWVRKVKAHADWVESLAFIPDGRGLVSGSEDATVKYWNVDWLGVFRGGLRGPDRRIERTGSTGRTAELSTPSHEFLGHNALVRSIATSPDGRWIVSGSFDRRVCIWDTKNLTLHCTLQGHGDSVLTVDFSPTERYIASGDLEGKVRLWRAED